MHDPAYQVEDIIVKYLIKELTEAEKIFLDQWLAGSTKNRRLFDDLTTKDTVSTDLLKLYSVDVEAGKKKIADVLFPGKVVKMDRTLYWRRYVAAASVIILLTASVYIGTTVFKNGKKPVASVKQQQPTDWPAGEDKAILTLGNGQQISIDSSVNGTLSVQGKTNIIKQGDRLVYNHSGGSSEVMYNTLSTPRAGQYQLVLPDGTKVWLNAASSITFPTVFVGKERLVKVTGEVYFEVAKNKAMPFRATANGMQVEVVGTHFNINAYEDELAVKTTLLEGKVKVSATKPETRNPKPEILHPGQQASLISSKSNKSPQIVVQTGVDISAVVAWKNGYFEFQDDISGVMRQLARWYNVEIVYADNMEGKHIGGRISRKENISKVLQMLEMTGAVKFQINGKKIIVKS